MLMLATAAAVTTDSGERQERFPEERMASSLYLLDSIQ